MGTHIRSSKHTTLICPRCKKIGGSLQKKLLNKIVRLPIKEEVTNLSTAWDYAGGCLLRISMYLTLSPPDETTDEDMSRSSYNHFSQFTQHSEAEIDEVELKYSATHFKHVKKRRAYFASQPRRGKDSEFTDATHKHIIHLELPRATEDIPKSAISCLYGTIVCCALRDLSKEVIQKPFSKDENQGFADAIYSVYNSLYSDARHSTSFMDLVETMADIHNYGYHGAAAINAIPTGYCLRCNKRGKRENVRMDRSEDSPTKWRCPKCGCTDVRTVPFTSKHLRNTQYGILEKLEVLVESLSLYFETIVDMYKHAIQHGPNAKEDFLKAFKEYELQATRNELFKQYRWVITHYDPSQKSRRRQCIISQKNFANIEIYDERYKFYKDAILEFAKVLTKDMSISQIMKGFEIAQRKGKSSGFYNAGQHILKEMGWPEAYIQDKLSHDISYALLTR